METKIKELEAEVKRLSNELEKSNESVETWIRIANRHEEDAKESAKKLSVIKQLMAIL